MDDQSSPSPEEARLLFDEAFSALESGDLDRAQTLALQLESGGDATYFELQANIFLQLELIDSAITVLRRGVRQSPRAWTLWQLLGNELAQDDELEEALDCYDHALAVPDADVTAVRFNRAMALARAERFPEALDELGGLLEAREQIENTALYWRVEAGYLGVLVELDRCDEVVERAAAMRLLLEATEDDDFETLSDAWSQGARALLDCGEKSRARDWAKEAFRLDRANFEAVELIRETREPRLEAELFFAVTFEGTLPGEHDEDGSPLGFFTTFMTVARNATEATRLAQELVDLRDESKSEEGELRLVACEAAGRCERQPLGVYEISPLSVFPLEDGE